jgi:uncharacterized OB-fold protein
MADYGEAPTRTYLAFLEQGRFMLQRSRVDGAFFFYPRLCAPGSGDEDLEWVEASGLGRVHATTVMRQRPPAPSYNIALIDLAEGPRMMSRVEGVAPDAVRIGMQVKAQIIREQDRAILVFRPQA